jgi:diguanylate cyclase (GGDEF)-like protein/PAS domain S-box-containing protein
VNNTDQLLDTFNGMANQNKKQNARVLSQTDPLKVSEENLHRLTDNMLYDVITQIGPDGIILYASPSHKWVLGIDAEKIIGTLIFERLHPDDKVEALAIFSRAVAEGKRPDLFALRYQHADGRYLWMECSSTILMDEQGKFNGAILSSRDITQRKEVEIALQKSELRYRLLADNASDVIWTMDLGLNITYVSPAVHKLRGYTPEEALSQNINDFLTSESAERVRQSIKEVISLAAVISPQELRREQRILELEMRRRDRSTVWAEIRLALLLDEQDKPKGIVGVTRDITERRKAADELRLLNSELEKRVEDRTADLISEIAERKRIEVALRDSETRYRAIMQQSLEAIYIHDVETLRLIEANPAFSTLLGYEVDEITNLTLYDIVAADKTDTDYLQQKILDGDGITLGERLWRRKDGTTVEVEVTANRIQQGERNMIFVVGRDITERKRAEIALRESEERYAIAVRGANDALWDWNLKTDEVYFSPRWSSMLGFDEGEIGNTLEEWFGRVHPQDLSHLQIAIGRHIDGNTSHFECEYRIRHSNKEYLWVLCRGLAVRDSEGKAYRMAGSQTDITDYKRVEERLSYDALHDALTGLPNRVLFMDRLGQRLEYAKRHPKNLFAVLFVDLDRFKVINDSLGHLVGDKFLVSVAHQLQSCLRPEDTISRLGGDEFAILLNEVHEISNTVRVAERIQMQLKSTAMLETVNRSSTASIGIAMYNGHYVEAQEMLRDADTAMYRAKLQGGNRYQIFDTTMYENALFLLQLESDLKLAVEKQEWQVYYQPIIELENGQISGVEALLRWIHPTRGMVMPLDFIPIAEETGLILPIGEYILRQACAQAKSWRDNGHPRLWISVNISGRQFQDKTLVEMVERVLSETGLPGDGLRLEITESVAMKDLAYSINVLKDLNKLGVNISLDDFGKGYSSLSYLKQFPLKVLKIDRSFIQEDDTHENSEAITSAIIFMGQTLNMEVVAEGVETEKQLNFLRSQFCDEVQGFLFSRPVPGEELTKLLNSRKNFMK